MIPTLSVTHRIWRGTPDSGSRFIGGCQVATGLREAALIGAGGTDNSVMHSRVG